MCCIGFAPNITLCIQDKSELLRKMVCSTTLVPCCKHVFEYFYSVQASFFSLCQLSYYCGVTTMLLIHLQFSPITAIKLCKCLKITISLMVKSLRGFLPLRQLSQEGCLYICSDLVYCITSPCSKGCSMSAFVYFLPIYQQVPFFDWHWKTSLVFEVESLCEIHCLTEGPCR